VDEKMSRLCLVRHGQTDWNLEGRYHGQSDVPLNDKGRSQAHRLAQFLEGQTFAAIYTSDLSRAKETAEIIAQTIPSPVILESRLREINQGEWEGQLVETIKARYAGLWNERIIDPTNVRPPGGETVGEVAKRVYAALDEITEIYSVGQVLICSHGLALATVLCKVQNIPVGQAYTMIPENTEPIWVNW
jgi:broad specificity phosphatase PhoE